MNEIVNTAEAIKELGVIGLLALATVVEAMIIRHLYGQLINCLKKGVKA